MRTQDLLSRLGGEEFAVLPPNTGIADAVVVAQGLRRTLEMTPLRYDGKSFSPTLSPGVAELGLHGDDWPQLYRAADAQLYFTKENGRNCVSRGRPVHAARESACT